MEVPRPGIKPCHSRDSFRPLTCFANSKLFSMRCLYILEINPLLVTSFAKIFFHSVSFFFIFFKVSFAMQKLLRLIRSHWFIFVFVVIILRGGSNKSAAIYVKVCSACIFLYEHYSIWPYI